MINVSAVPAAKSRLTEYLPALKSLLPTVKSNGMFALTVPLSPANPMIDMGMIRASVARMLSICFFKITSLWYLCSGLQCSAADFYLHKMRYGASSPECDVLRTTLTLTLAATAMFQVGRFFVIL